MEVFNEIEACNGSACRDGLYLILKSNSRGDAWYLSRPAGPTTYYLRLPPDYWMLQLETITKHADGVVIWGGWGDHGPEPWNEEAPWWQVTKRFMQRLGPSSLSSPTAARAQ